MSSRSLVYSCPKTDAGDRGTFRPSGIFGRVSGLFLGCYSITGEQLEKLATKSNIETHQDKRVYGRIRVTNQIHGNHDDKGKARVDCREVRQDEVLSMRGKPTQRKHDDNSDKHSDELTFMKRAVLNVR